MSTCNWISCDEEAFQMKFILKTPDNITGGILLFGAAMIIGIAELYLVRKAYQARVQGQSFLLLVDLLVLYLSLSIQNEDSHCNDML
jgi:hypothetical protein